MNTRSYIEMFDELFKVAILNKDSKAIEQVSRVFTDTIKKVDELEKSKDESQNDIKILAQTMQEGFRQMDKRFEQVDKRFEDLIHYMDKRFDTMQWVIGIGFTVITALSVLFKFMH